MGATYKIYKTIHRIALGLIFSIEILFVFSTLTISDIISLLKIDINDNIINISILIVIVIAISSIGTLSLRCLANIINIILGKIFPKIKCFTINKEHRIKYNYFALFISSNRKIINDYLATPRLVDTLTEHILLAYDISCNTNLDTVKKYNDREKALRIKSDSIKKLFETDTYKLFSETVAYENTFTQVQSQLDNSIDNCFDYWSYYFCLLLLLFIVPIQVYEIIVFSIILTLIMFAIIANQKKKIALKHLYYLSCAYANSKGTSNMEDRAVD